MTNRTHRIRRIGLLGVALTTLLSPAGILISSAIATTALVGGLALHAQRSAPADPEAHQRQTALRPPDGRHLFTAAPETIRIEHQGENIPIVLVDGSNPQHTLQRLDPILLAFDIPPAPPANPGPGQPRRGPLPESTLPGNALGVGPGKRRPEPAPENHAPSAPKPTIPPPGEEGPVKHPDTPKSRKPDNNTPALPENHEPAPKPTIPPPAEEGPVKHPDTPKSRKPDDNTPTLPKITTLPDDQVPPLLTRETGETQRNPAAIPEPSVLGLMGLGLVAMAWMGRRQRALLRHA